MATRVFVSEDHPVYREGLVESIRDRAELELVGESGDGQQAVDRIRALRPDLALIDLRLPKLDGIGVLRALASDTLDTRVLILSAFSDGALVYEALEAGAAGYISKDAAAEEIVSAIRCAAAGETVLSPGLEQRLAAQINRNQARSCELSAREREIVELISDGHSSGAIGEKLHLSEGTIKTYTRRAFEKLGVSSRPAAIAEAMRRGILT